MGHDARGWECYVDARWRLPHRAVLNDGLGMCACILLMLVFVTCVVVECLSFSSVGSFLYPLRSLLL